MNSIEPAFFGGVVGEGEYTSPRSATLRRPRREHSKAPAPLLLEPYGCNALATSGAGHVHRGGRRGRRPAIEGLITVDSNATQMNGPGGWRRPERR